MAPPQGFFFILPDNCPALKKEWPVTHTSRQQRSGEQPFFMMASVWVTSPWHLMQPAPPSMLYRHFVISENQALSDTE